MDRKISRDVLILLISVLIWGIGENAFLIFQPLYLQELGASPVDIGQILGIVGFVMMISHLPAGYLSDRIDPRFLLWASWIIGIFASMIMAFATSMRGFVIGAVIYGSTIFVLAPMDAYLASAREKLSIGRVLTLVGVAFNIGAFIGPMIGGWIAEVYSIRHIFFFSTVCFLISTGILFMLRPQVSQIPTTKEKIHISLQIKRMGFALGTAFFIIFALYLPYPLAANYLTNVHQIDYQQIGQLGSFLSLGAVFLNLTMGSITPILGIIISQILVVSTSILFLKGSGFLAFSLAFFAFGGYKSAHALISAQINALFQDFAGNGLSFGLIYTFTSLAIACAPPIAGILYEISPDYIFMMSILLILLSLPSLLILRAKKVELQNMATKS